MLQLSGRPLTASRLDGELFVDREQELLAIGRASQMRFNVYVLGDVGMGKTSLLRRVQAHAEGPSAFVNAAAIDGFDRLLAAIAGAVGSPVPDTAVVEGGHPLGPLRSAVDGSRTDAGPTIIVDDLEPRLRHELFGRQRDELWELPIRWIVTGRDRLIPPADAFFETQLRLEALDQDDLHELLVRRAERGDGPERERLLELAVLLPPLLAPTSPRRMLAASRAAMVGPDPASALSEMRRQRSARAHLSEPETRVLETLDAIGPTHASDERLLREVGTSRSRVVQLLRALEQDGLVMTSRDGRRKLYGAREPGVAVADRSGATAR